MGAGNSYDVNATGGSKDAIVVSHNHSASTSVSGSTASAGNHRHAIKRSNSDSGFGGSVGTDAVGSNYVYSEYAGAHTQALSVSASTTVTNVPNHTHTVRSTGTATASIPNHTHTFTTDGSGSTSTNRNLPPYYALAYIMKL